MPRQEDVSKLPAGATDINLIRRYLDANVDRQCHYLLDAKTGKLRSAVPGFLFMSSPHPPPVVTPEGLILFVHSGWYWGETSPAWLSEMHIGPEKTEVKDLAKGSGGGGRGGCFGFFPADIYSRLTGCGDIVFLVSRTSGGYEYKTDKLVSVPIRTSDMTFGKHGIVPAENCLFAVSGENLVCVQSQGGK